MKPLSKNQVTDLGNALQDQNLGYYAYIFFPFGDESNSENHFQNT